MKNHTVTTTSNSKIIFPTWKSLLLELIDEIGIERQVTNETVSGFLNNYLEKLNFIRENVPDYPPAMPMQVLINAAGDYIPGAELDEVLAGADLFQIGANEFYSIYDIKSTSFINVDHKVESILGISSSTLTIEALFGLDENNPLFHPEDVDHMARWAGIAYVVLCFPGFSFEPMSDYYKVNFRVSLEKSSNQLMKKINYVMLEKRCYIVHDCSTQNIEPRFHFDRWTVYDTSQFEYVSPVFATNFKQGAYMNAFAYLLNAFLLAVPTKYIAILEEKRKTDRNKAVANELNKNIREYTGVEYEFDEYQIGDYFAKSIRPKMAEVMSIWDRSSRDITVLSDQEAIHCARKLGLIPVPSAVKHLLYRNIID